MRTPPCPSSIGNNFPFVVPGGFGFDAVFGFRHVWVCFVFRLVLLSSYYS